MSHRQLAMLVALSAIWGASFMFIKVGVRKLDPITLVAFRVALGALSLAPVLLVALGREGLRQLRVNVRPIVVIGLLNSAIPFWSLSWAETRIDSGLAAVIQASAPLFTALLALRFSRTERVTGARLAGLLVGFVGVVLLVGAQPRGDVVAALAVVFSALCYAAAALYAGRVVASVLALGVGGTGIAYILYYGLIAGAGASRSSLVTYLVPRWHLATARSCSGKRSAPSRWPGSRSSSAASRSGPAPSGLAGAASCPRIA